MMYLKACTKCSGDLILEKDSYGAFLKCLQCGKFVEVTEVNGNQPLLHGAATTEVALQAAKRGKVKVAVAA